MATGETKISISSWGSDLYDGEDAHMAADALTADESNITVGNTPDANYAAENVSSMRPPTMTPTPPTRPSWLNSCTRPTQSSLQQPQDSM